MRGRRIMAVVAAMLVLAVVAVAGLFVIMAQDLPHMITVADYRPLLVSEVFDRKQSKIGEFFRERRELVAFDQIPQQIVHAFVAAEDSSFFSHSGINYVAMFRAFLANVKAGRKVQGGSTITMQVARSLLLSSIKTYERKIKEVLLSWQMEQNLSKAEILYLYLNQIYLGHGAYGVAQAAKIYYRKELKELSLPEVAMLAGLPQAPSRYSPVINPQAAKERQRYVLARMREDNYITQAEYEAALLQPVVVYSRRDYQEIAPFYLESIRQLLVEKLGEAYVLDRGIRIHTGLDLDLQTAAQQAVRTRLRELDKRQGYRGPLRHIANPAENQAEVMAFLKATRDAKWDQLSPQREITADGTTKTLKELNLTGLDPETSARLPNLPTYLPVGESVEAVVTQVMDDWGLVAVRFAESKALIDIDTMKWARPPDPTTVYSFAEIKKPSQALKSGDIIMVSVQQPIFKSERLRKLLKEKKSNASTKDSELLGFDPTEYAGVELEQEPLVEAALVSFDQTTGDILAMVGGYDFSRSQFNRAIQAARQTGSAFKALVYTAALDKEFTPATRIVDAPMVYEELTENPDATADADDNDAFITKKWTPSNHSQQFQGDILFRRALIQSLNVPTVKVIEQIGVDWAADYARRLGIFSPLNLDYTLALGSSAITLYEVTKAFAHLGRLGKRLRPMLIHKVESIDGEVLAENISLDERFATQMQSSDEAFAARREQYLKYQKQLQAAADLDSPADNEEVSFASPPERQEAAVSDANPRIKLPDPAKEPPLFFEDPDQLIRPETAFVITNILQGVIGEKGGTGARARALGRPVAGKTGTTNEYYDGWFVGFTPDVAAGVWVGFDEEKSLGRGEVGGRNALPIWLDYMLAAHKDLPEKSFAMPDNIVFANIDNETGQLASARTKNVVRQAFIGGTEPQLGSTRESREEDAAEFFKEDLVQ